MAATKYNGIWPDGGITPHIHWFLVRGGSRATHDGILKLDDIRDGGSYVIDGVVGSFGALPFGV